MVTNAYDCLLLLTIAYCCGKLQPRRGETPTFDEHPVARQQKCLLVFTIAYYWLLSAARARGEQEEGAEEDGGREGSEAGTLAWGRGKEAETRAR